MSARRRTYAVTMQWSSSAAPIGEYTSLSDAKRAARLAWDERNGGRAVRIEWGGRSIEATQKNGAGMRWTA